MKDVDDCPGEGKCHGPSSWCSRCGDVALTCDDPACDGHNRLDELKQNAAKWAEEMRRAAGPYLDALRNWTEAEEKAVAYELARAEGRLKMKPRRTT